MRVGIIVSVCLAIAATGARGATYQSAKDAYDQGRIEEARKAFAEIGADSHAPAIDRVGAATGLARIAWLIDGDSAAATAQLRNALALPEDECATRTMMARILREAHRPADALAAATERATCGEQSQRDDLLIEQARAELDLDQAAAAERTLEQLSELGRLAPDASAVKLDAALALGRPEEALAAWRGYYWLTAGDAPQGLVKDPVDRLFATGAGLESSQDGQCALLDLLLRAGFDEAARRFAGKRKLDQLDGPPLCRKAQAYFDFRDKFGALALQAYRRMAHLDPSDKDGLQKAANEFADPMSTIFQETAAKLKGLVTAAPDAGPIKLIHDAFNFGSTFGFTGGYPSAHIGHVIRNETREVEQYGRSATLNFRVYDRMISNGFQSWLWDGEKQTGGWGTGDTIVQIRPPYAARTIAATALSVDPAPPRNPEDRARSRSRDDAGLLAAARAAGRKVVYLPGLADRLKLQWIDQVAAAVGNREDADFAHRFAAREDELTARHSIWIHEGRHALDAKYLKDRKFDPAELEYRAKLAEILLGDLPRMAFASINDSLINSDSSHGIANARIMSAYADWIAAHPHAIAGYDPEAPALLQFDKLSDAQLRAVAAALADFDVSAARPHKLASRARSLP
jgi:hypothetical protein